MTSSSPVPMISSIKNKIRVFGSLFNLAFNSTPTFFENHINNSFAHFDRKTCPITLSINISISLVPILISLFSITLSKILSDKDMETNTIMIS